MTGIKFWLRKVTKTWRQLLVTGGTVLAIGACGPGLDSLGPFSIGGEITGLTGTDRVVLQNNSGDDLTFTGSGSFTFSTLVPTDGAYVVTVRTQPTGMVCTVSNGSGTAKADVTTTSVQCGAPWTGTKQLGVAGEVTQGLSVAVDASGNVYVAGYTTGALSTNPAGQANTLTGNTDFFVTKIDIGGYVGQLGHQPAGWNFGLLRHQVQQQRCQTAYPTIRVYRQGVFWLGGCHRTQRQPVCCRGRV